MCMGGLCQSVLFSQSSQLKNSVVRLQYVSMIFQVPQRKLRPAKTFNFTISPISPRNVKYL